MHASSMRARSFFHNIHSDDDDDEAMRTSRIMERMVCIQAVRWRDAAAASQPGQRTVWELWVGSGSHDDEESLIRLLG